MKDLKNTAFARADSKGGNRIGSVDDYHFVVWQVVCDRVGEIYGLSVVDCRYVNATPDKFINESGIVKRT